MTPPHPLAIVTRAALILGLLVLLGGSARADQLGDVTVLVFDRSGRPASGRVVAAPSVRATTGTDGVARLRLPAGKHSLQIRWRKTLITTVTTPVAWGETTEVIVRLTNPPLVDVEAPGWPGSEAKSPQTPIKLGTLAGRVVDATTKTPVPRARILIRGELAEATTDAQGTFRIAVPVGVHAVSVVHAEYTTTTRSGVSIAYDEVSTLTLILTPSAVELETHSVSGYRLDGGLAALMQDRRDGKAVTDVLGAEQMSKSGDSDAAQALKRVTGLTVVGGKYVYVRGMGERYSSTLLNGSTLPSPEPEQRVVPLDLFPTNVIESITVQKSYTPNLPGEFGGGAVLLRTRGIPEEFFVKASVKGGWVDGTTNQRGLSYKGSSTDWLGYDNGTRSIPPLVQTAAGIQPISLQDPFTGEGYSPQVLEALGEQMPNVWSVRRKKVTPDLGVNLAAGDRAMIAGRPLGFRVAVGYENSNRIREGRLRAFGLGSGGALEPIVDYATESLTNTVDFSSQASIGFKPAKNHELTVEALWLRRTQDTTEVYQGLLANDDTVIRVSNLNFLEQQLISAQTRGEHTLFDLFQAKWRYTYSLATRWQPDSRRFRYDFDPTSNRYLLSTRPEGNQRLYNDLIDNNHDAALDLIFPFETSAVKGSVKAGGGYIFRDRESETRRFKFIHRGPDSQDPDTLASAPEQIFSPENIGPNGFSFEEITRATDNYQAEQSILAGYAQLELTFYETFDVSFGMRVERSEQDVETFELFSRTSVPDSAQLHTTDYLPAVNLGWRLSETMQLRGGYSRTLSRPDFRELSTSPFDQVVGAGVFIGNPDLDRTRIDNLDLRWEMYLSTDETISIGLFYKLLHDPIETVVLGGSNRTITLDNAESAENFGIEIEFRKNLGFVGRGGERFYLAGNLSLIHSQVELGSTGIATNDDRPLQGQSPYVINLSVGFDDPDLGLSAAVLYNVFGERIVGIGTLGLDDIYEQPFHQLDVVAAYSFWTHWKIGVKFKNLLDGVVEQTQDGEIVSSYRRGREVSFTLSAEF